MESILKTVRKFIGPAEDYDYFDPELIMSINSALNFLNHGGIGVKGFTISDDTATWEDFLGDKLNLLSSAETYVCLSVKLDFDPPSNSFLVDRYKARMEEIFWRLIAMMESSDSEWDS